MGSKQTKGQQGAKVEVITKQKPVAKQLGKAPAEIEPAFFDMVAKIQNMTLEEVFADKGLDFEIDQSRAKLGGRTLRITKGWRALCFLRTGPVIEIYAIKDPTSAHSVRRR